MQRILPQKREGWDAKRIILKLPRKIYFNYLEWSPLMEMRDLEFEGSLQRDLKRKCSFPNKLNENRRRNTMPLTKYNMVPSSEVLHFPQGIQFWFLKLVDIKEKIFHIARSEERNDYEKSACWTRRRQQFILWSSRNILQIKLNKPSNRARKEMKTS